MNNSKILIGFLLGIIFFASIAIDTTHNPIPRETTVTSLQDKEQAPIANSTVSTDVVSQDKVLTVVIETPATRPVKRNKIATFEPIAIRETITITQPEQVELLSKLPIEMVTFDAAIAKVDDSSITLEMLSNVSEETISENVPMASFPVVISDTVFVSKSIPETVEIIQDTFKTVMVEKEILISTEIETDYIDSIELAHDLVITSESIQNTSEILVQAVEKEETPQLDISLGEDYLTTISEDIVFTVQEAKISERLRYIVIEKTKNGVQHINTIDKKPLYSGYYQNVLPFNDMGTAFAQKNDTTWCIVGIDGIEFMPTPFKKIEESYYGIVTAQLSNEKWQYVNPFGQTIHDKGIMFDKVTPFSYLDKNGEPCAKGLIIGGLKSHKKQKELEVLYKIYRDGRVEIADPSEPIIGYLVKK